MAARRSLLALVGSLRSSGACAGGHVARLLPARVTPVAALPRMLAASARWSSNAAPPPAAPGADATPATSAVPGAMHGGDKSLLMYTCTVCNTRSARVISKVRCARERGGAHVRLPPRCASFPCRSNSSAHAVPLAQLAYAQGVVLVRCPGCQSLHLIADRLGYFASAEEVEATHAHAHAHAHAPDGSGGGAEGSGGGGGVGAVKRRGLDIEAIMAAKGQRVVRGVVRPGAPTASVAAAAGGGADAGDGAAAGGGGQSAVDGNVYEWTAADLAVLASPDKSVKVGGEGQ
jgi:hypothetical protein